MFCIGTRAEIQDEFVINKVVDDIGERFTEKELVTILLSHGIKNKELISDTLNFLVYRKKLRKDGKYYYKLSREEVDES